MFAKDPMMWKVHFAPPGALEKYLESDQQVEWATYLTEVVSASTKRKSRGVGEV